MICTICRLEMVFYFRKSFHQFGLDVVDYWRCNHCGFVLSKTHLEMTESEWSTLNHEVHSSYQGTESDDFDPRWLDRLDRQSYVLNDLKVLGCADRNHGRWLDYACGDGKLSDLLHGRFGLELLKYDKFMCRGDDYLQDRDLVADGFDVVVTTSVFEHLRTRDQFDYIESLVKGDGIGIQGIHTLVCEEVPQDPTWFYLTPVHCSFHTNRSMEVLFREWGYTCSLYCVAGQLWFWFKTRRPQDVAAIVARANTREDGPSYIFKEGFVDYWKCRPVRETPNATSTLADGSGEQTVTA